MYKMCPILCQSLKLKRAEIINTLFQMIFFFSVVIFLLPGRVDDVEILRPGYASAHKMLLRKTIKFL